MKNIKELLIAQAVADAFGYKVEFESINNIKNTYGDRGLLFNHIEGQKLYASDDTQMSLYTLEGLIDLKDEMYDDANSAVHDAYIRWNKTQMPRLGNVLPYSLNNEDGISEHKEMWVRRAPGNTCLQALNSPVKASVSNRINNSKGCGGVMRVLPSVFFAEDEKQAFEYGISFAAITHSHPTGFYSAGAYNVIGFNLLKGHDVDFSIEATKKYLNNYEAKETLDFLNKAQDLLKNKVILRDDEIVKHLGDGFTAETAMAIAIYVGLQKDLSYEDVVEWSTNHSGDSDSTAMMAAGLWYLNKENTSKEFLKYEAQLDLNNVINSISDRYRKVLGLQEVEIKSNNKFKP